MKGILSNIISIIIAILIIIGLFFLSLTLDRLRFKLTVVEALQDINNGGYNQSK